MSEVNKTIDEFVSLLNTHFMSELSDKITEDEAQSYKELQTAESKEFAKFGNSEKSETSDLKSDLEYIKNTMDDISKTCLDDKDNILKTLSWIYIELFMNIYLISEDDTRSDISYENLKKDYDFIQKFQEDNKIDIIKTFEILARHYDEEFGLYSCSILTIRELVENFMKVMNDMNSGKIQCINKLQEYILNLSQSQTAKLNQSKTPNGESNKVCNIKSLVSFDCGVSPNNKSSSAAGGSTNKKSSKNKRIIIKKITA